MEGGFAIGGGGFCCFRLHTASLCFAAIGRQAEAQCKFFLSSGRSSEAEKRVDEWPVRPARIKCRVLSLVILPTASIHLSLYKRGRALLLWILSPLPSITMATNGGRFASRTAFEALQVEEIESDEEEVVEQQQPQKVSSPAKPSAAAAKKQAAKDQAASAKAESTAKPLHPASTPNANADDAAAPSPVAQLSNGSNGSNGSNAPTAPTASPLCLPLRLKSLEPRARSLRRLLRPLLPRHPSRLLLLLLLPLLPLPLLPLPLLLPDRSSPSQLLSPSPSWLRLPNPLLLPARRHCRPPSRTSHRELRSPKRRPRRRRAPKMQRLRPRPSGRRSTRGRCSRSS